MITVKAADACGTNILFPIIYLRRPVRGKIFLIDSRVGNRYAVVSSAGYLIAALLAIKSSESNNYAFFAAVFAMSLSASKSATSKKVEACIDGQTKFAIAPWSTIIQGAIEQIVWIYFIVSFGFGDDRLVNFAAAVLAAACGVLLFLPILNLAYFLRIGLRLEQSEKT